MAYTIAYVTMHAIVAIAVLIHDVDGPFIGNMLFITGHVLDV